MTELYTDILGWDTFFFFSVLKYFLSCHIELDSADGVSCVL